MSFVNFRFNLSGDDIFRSIKHSILDNVPKTLLPEIAKLAKEAMKDKIQLSDAVATGDLLNRISVQKQGDRMVVGAFVSPSASASFRAKAGAVDEGTRRHVVRADTPSRLKLFKPWAQARGLTHTNGPFFFYAGKRRVHKPLNDLEDNRKNIRFYIEVANSPASSLYGDGVQFVKYANERIVDNIDSLVREWFERNKPKGANKFRLHF